MLESFAGAEGGTLALLALGLAIAFGFEFVNGFHDTANAVSTRKVRLFFDAAVIPVSCRLRRGPVQWLPAVSAFQALSPGLASTKMPVSRVTERSVFPPATGNSVLRPSACQTAGVRCTRSLLPSA